MQRKESASFSIVDEDDDFQFDEDIVVENAREIPSPILLKNQEENAFGKPQKESTDSDSTDSGVKFKNLTDLRKMEANKPFQGQNSSAGPSGRQQIRLRSPPMMTNEDMSSDSDSGESETKKKKRPIPGEYNPADYENLQVNDEVKDLFQYISKYILQNLNLDFKFKPFIPDYIPAVGDIDAFIKVVPPDVTITGEPYAEKDAQLGLTVLDEPAASQSDPAVLHLQLRAASVNVSQSANVVVKKVDNVDKNLKVVEKWIKDISDLHKSKSSPFVKYSDLMPELDDLMQEWPEPMENMLKTQGFPNYKLRGPISEYADIICSIFDIPVYKNRIQSLHLLFSLYAAVKNSQLYKATTFEEKENSTFEKSGNTDQLVLD